MNDMHTPLDDLLTPAEVAKRLGVSPITVRSWVAKGWLTSSVTPGGHRRFYWKDVQALLAQRNQATFTPQLLIVDDDPLFRSYLIDAFATLLPDAIVRVAIDGFHTGIALAAYQPDLVLLDYAMPGMNGLDVCHLIKSNPDYAKTRVVILTGIADPALHMEFMQARADSVLLKPIAFKTLEAVLDQFHLRIPVSI